MDPLTPPNLAWVEATCAARCMLVAESAEARPSLPRLPLPLSLGGQRFLLSCGPQRSGVVFSRAGMPRTLSCTAACALTVSRVTAPWRPLRRRSTALLPPRRPPLLLPMRPPRLSTHQWQQTHRRRSPSSHLLRSLPRCSGAAASARCRRRLLCAPGGWHVGARAERRLRPPAPLRGRAREAAPSNIVSCIIFVCGLLPVGCSSGSATRYQRNNYKTRWRTLRRSVPPRVSPVQVSRLP